MWIPAHGMVPPLAGPLAARAAERPDGREDDRRVEFFRKWFVGATGPCRAKVEREPLRGDIARS